MIGTQAADADTAGQESSSGDHNGQKNEGARDRRDIYKRAIG